MILSMPVEVEDVAKQVCSPFQFQTCRLCLLRPSGEAKCRFTTRWVDVSSELHFSTVLNDRIRSGGQIELNSLRVMDSDLVRLQMNHAVSCLVYKACSADAANIYSNILHVFHINTLDAERQDNYTVSQILDDHILFAFVLLSCFHYILITLHIFD